MTNAKIAGRTIQANKVADNSLTAADLDGLELLCAAVSVRPATGDCVITAQATG